MEISTASSAPSLWRRVGPIPAFLPRPQVRGKFLFVGDQKFDVRGVTYGPFRSDGNGEEYGDRRVVQRDLARMAEHGFNAVRIYTIPPLWFLDCALEHGLRVMVGLPWEQHISFLDDPAPRRLIEARTRSGVIACQRHPAVFCFAVGNEIPSGVVRWHGRRAVERFLDRLATTVKEEDPDALVTYVNYPSTEYLRPSAVDLVSFNVYLERQATFESYLARLHNLADDRPLLMTEIGLDSRRNGAEAQAQTLDWQVRTAMASGCAGAFVFAWTDEWHRSGRSIEDWDFGLTTRDRTPKPALSSVREAFADAPFSNQAHWPPVSVVVCTRNGARTLRECLRGLERLDYPNYEVIVVDDGSRDETPRIASKFNCRLISTPNRGLSEARNTGWRAATGEIIAYIDDDAYPDPQWLRHLVITFQGTRHAAVGGPNRPPAAEGLIAQCLRHAPGGPTHVLLTDEIAEHIPGCNMAFRRKVLEDLGGFDPQFQVAGDDVDMCWRVQERSWTIGFSPAAMVWHHRRSSVAAYWGQQQGYGKAEALLERKWPDKYNAAGHVTWSGRVYDKSLSELFARYHVYGGVWGCAPFQRLYQGKPLTLFAIPCLPEWWLVIFGLAVLALLGLLWRPLLWSGALAGGAFGLIAAQAIFSAHKVSTWPLKENRSRRLRRFVISVGLHLLQPLARLIGRVRSGLTAWRFHGPRNLVWPRRMRFTVWSEQWRSPAEWLHLVESHLKRSRSVVLKGGPFDQWDLEVRGGLLGAARSQLLVEEHGHGRQFLKFRSWPRFRVLALIPLFTFASLALLAGTDHATIAAFLLGVLSMWIVVRMSRECAWAQGALKAALARLDQEAQDRVNRSS
jgi:O-antigen biosynthesis protein